MGLDAYLYDADNVPKYVGGCGQGEVAYWRNAWLVHNWLRDIVPGVENDEFVTFGREKLAELVHEAKRAVDAWHHGWLNVAASIFPPTDRYYRYLRGDEAMDASWLWLLEDGVIKQLEPLLADGDPSQFTYFPAY